MQVGSNNKMNRWIHKADTLLEALPYIQKFRGALIVVKFGGSSMEDPELVKSTMRDIVLMECIGFKPIVVHGGGKAISAELKKQDIPVKFVNGLRHTCERTIKVVDDVLHNQVNRNLVELAASFGGPAVAISGKRILTAEKIYSKDPVTGEELDVGFVGGITHVDSGPVQAALAAGQIPIITPLGMGRDGQIYNINADIAACRITEAVHARKLVFLSDVPGVMLDPADENSVIPTIRTERIPELVRERVLSGGMLPKINSCVHALEAGINKVHMIDGRVRHSLLLEIFTDEGIGTQIVRPDSEM